MTRDDWVSDFVDELTKLRPHLAGSKVAYTIALSKYDAKEQPRDVARQYHKGQQPSPATKRKK